MRNIALTIKNHASFVKLLITVVAVAFFIVAIVVIHNTERLNHNQQVASNAAVINHTQTLNYIKQAVTQLKASNAADHAQTVTYINCVLVGLTNSTAQSQALAIYKQCLANSGITTASN